MKICQIDQSEIESMVSEELRLHPFLEPVDLYKLLYQALYGPFHIVRDFKQLCLGISAEIWRITEPYLPHYQDIGPGYTRISLSSIKHDGSVDRLNERIESLSNWILASCMLCEDVRQDFRERWRNNRHLLSNALPASPEAWQLADSLAERGELPSHSKLFHQHYEPHYRLVDMSLKQYREDFLELNT
ncbi:MAG: hypothetical protein M0R50_02395 [Candidatus Cloacimonetes bacterium]|jgi:hypothetical protein|nr:hypothetical protein [Candidatus Cloacimonadota bacterium]MDD4559755.1 hypothetical protein [Candidatus Cloacimonadota bacterium]